MPRAIALKGVTPPEQFKAKEPEKLYRLHDVLAELAAQGWEVVPNRRMKLGYGFERPRAGDPIVAEYRRKCGATRRIVVPHPPPHYYRVPFYNKKLFSAVPSGLPLDAALASVLDFRFVGYERDIDQFGQGPYIAVYEEQ